MGLADGGFYELEKFPEMFLLREFGLGKFYSHAAGGSAASGYTADDYAFDPDFAAGQPQADFQGLACRNGAGGFDEAPSAADVGEVAPNGLSLAFDSNFYGDVAFDAMVAAAAGFGRWSKEIGLEGRRLFYGLGAEKLLGRIGRSLGTCGIFLRLCLFLMFFAVFCVVRFISLSGFFAVLRFAGFDGCFFDLAHRLQ